MRGDRTRRLGALLAVFVLIAAAPPAWADMSAAFTRAERFVQPGFRDLVPALGADASWIAGTEQVLFHQSTPGGRRQMVFDAARRSTRPLLDEPALRRELSVRSGVRFDGPLSAFDVEAGPDRRTLWATITWAQRDWRCELGRSPRCRRAQEADALPAGLPSPDGRWVAQLRGHDLFVVEVGTGTDRQLTRGLTAATGLRLPMELEGPSTVLRPDVANDPRPPLVWSPDSRRLIGHVYDYTDVRRLSIIQASPSKGEEPAIFSYFKPHAEDANIGSHQFIAFDVATGASWRSPSIVGDAESLPVWAGGGGQTMLWVERSRDGRTVMLRAADLAATEPAPRTLLQIYGDTVPAFSPDYVGIPPVVAPVNGGRDLVLWLDRDGWGHLYLVDAATGRVRRQLTHGDFTVTRIAAIDDTKQIIFFAGGDPRPGHTPTQQLLYRVGFGPNGPAQECLTPESADHGDGDAPALSDSKRYFIDHFSTPQQAPTTVVRRSDGQLVGTLGTVDVISLTGTGWAPPEPFVVKGADGRTDIFGAIYKPTDFDPAKRYAVVDAIYPGVFQTASPTRFRHLLRDMRQATAEIGFIVVAMDGRGMSYRSKSFQDFAYGNLGLGGLVDHVAAIRALATSRPYMDVDRVGLYGFSAGGDGTIDALISYPDFFKVGVAMGMSGATYRTHEPGYAEHWMARDYAAMDNGPRAGRIKGKLLLLHGELDDHANPAFMMQFYRAARAAGADVDMTVVPNADHGGVDLLRPDGGRSPDLLRTLWRYLHTHLGGPR